MAKKSNNYKGVAQRGLSIIAGLAIGTYAKKFVGQKDATSGTDLLGLSGDTSAIASPAIITVAGFAVNTMSKNPILKDVGLGMIAAGGAGMLNAATGKSIVSLNGTDDQPVEALPVALPGLGIDEKVTYDELPTDNELLTTYHPEIEEVGDIDEYGYEEEVGAVDDLL